MIVDLPDGFPENGESQAGVAGWETHPQNLTEYDPITTDGEFLSDQLRSLSPTLFLDPDEKQIQVSIIDVHDSDEDALAHQHHAFTSLVELEHFILHQARQKTRMISVSQEYSLNPLNITEELMRKILSFHQVSPSFLAILLACGDQPRVCDEGLSNVSLEKSSDGSFSKIYSISI
jgi:hypothetical protein